VKKTHLIWVLVLAVLAGYAGAKLAVRGNAGTGDVMSAADDITYLRVRDTGTIRCGYLVTHPFLFKDPNPGALSGIAHDAIEKMAANMSLKVEWTEEVGFSTLLEGLSTRRFDVLCSAIWATTSRGLAADFLKPLSYAGVHAWVRPGDVRFKNGLEGVDWKNIRISTIDGHISDILARAKYPEAQRISLPDMTMISENFMAVAQGKADITFEQNYVALEYLSHNPGAVISVTKEKPIKVFPTNFLIPKGEEKLKSMLNTAQDELTNSGVIGALIDQYETYPGSFYRVAKPYELTP
jgi:polar amino acid transport system substrate-binding protein